MFPGMDGSDGEWKSDSSLTVDSVTVDHILTCTDVEIVARGEAARRQTSRLGFSQELLQDYHQHQLMRRSLRRNSGNLLEMQYMKNILHLQKINRLFLSMMLQLRFPPKYAAFCTCSTKWCCILHLQHHYPYTQSGASILVSISSIERPLCV